ncbi:Leucine-rich repeat, ribonuclease inhibitor subtype [Verrucomicrobia bacterium]|nr:Leucine-rich repeat, ribonuclease inhibitor subtype [Verrucomicrobiota bacterium]
MSTPSETALFFGRFHPLLVHLPIGLILLLALLELLALAPRFKAANANAGLILGLAVPVAIVSVVCGWLLSSSAGYPADLLQWHKWSGISTAALCAMAALSYWLDCKRLYRVLLFFGVATLTVASHFGGSLTHGSDYLVRYAPAPFRRFLGAKPILKVNPDRDLKPSVPQPFFTQNIQPLFQQNCVVCHGPDKSKAKLRLDSFAALLKGGDSGPVVVPGKSGQSELIERLRLPLDHEDHMPPQGKPQPSPEDLALLEWWIDAGAPADKTMADLHPPASIARILQARSGLPALVTKIPPPRPLADILPIAARLADELGIVISPLGQEAPWLQCNASLAGTNFADPQLAQLAPLDLNLRWLDLAGTKVTDAGLAHMGELPNLARLHLERTDISDAGLAHLAALPSLEYLDLYGTQVTDAGLAHLQDSPRLKHLFLWQTRVTPAAAKAFADSRADQAQIQAWQSQIADLEARIQDLHVSVDLGSATPSPTNSEQVPSPTDRGASKASPAVNALCPVSGKPVDPAKTLVFEGRVVAFCCDDCKAKFASDPKPFASKLGLKEAKSN